MVTVHEQVLMGARLMRWLGAAFRPAGTSGSAPA
jgi:hypothetical protein